MAGELAHKVRKQWANSSCSCWLSSGYLHLGTVTWANVMKHWPCSADCSHSYSFWPQGTCMGKWIFTATSQAAQPAPHSLLLPGLSSLALLACLKQCIMLTPGEESQCFLKQLSFNGKLVLHWTWLYVTGDYFNHSSSDRTLYRKNPHKILMAIMHHRFYWQLYILSYK